MSEGEGRVDTETQDVLEINPLSGKATPQNCATADELFECVWPFSGVGAENVKIELKAA